MEKTSNTIGSPVNSFIQEAVQTHVVINQLQSVEKYLNLNSFSHNPNEILYKEEIPHNQAKDKIRTAQRFKPTKSTPKAKHVKSPFHNFQKHLITIIRRFVSFCKNKLLQEEQGALACAIWTIFLSDRTANKKMLHLAFGVVQINTSVLQLQLLSRKHEAFRKLYSEHSHQRICAAQQLLREKTVEQARALSKQLLEDHCSIGKFEQFHLYFRSFIAEIEAGPLARRLTKEAKARMTPKKTASIETQ